MTATTTMPRHEPDRRERVFVVLAGIFVTHALLGELMGGKLFELGGWVMSVGVIPWPFVFVATDLVNEHYGLAAVRRLTLLSIGLILYAFVVVYACMAVPASDVSVVSDEAFAEVFGQSMWIIGGSVTAFAVSQLLDARVFVWLRQRWSGRHLWARALGSTVVSQLVDTFVINYLAFWLPAQLDGSRPPFSAGDALELSVTNYGYKFVIAVGTLPVIYLGHSRLRRYFAGRDPKPEPPEPGEAEAPKPRD
ncbi:MAG: queuosine precursor transporter [Nannocystaceae bacterium]|nr:queuosine precursor transporter [Nannocystaceae bacterium]